MNKLQRELLQAFGEKIHNSYLRRRTCPHELECYKNAIEPNYKELFKEQPGLAKVLTEMRCTEFSTNPNICPFYLLSEEKITEFKTSFRITIV